MKSLKFHGEMEPRHHRSIQPSKIHKRRSNFENDGDKIISRKGESSSGYFDNNNKLLLEVQVTESLSTDMSSRISRANDNLTEEKNHVEVTIMKPLSGRISSGISGRVSACISARSNENNPRAPTKILNPVHEKNRDILTVEKANTKHSRTLKLNSSLDYSMSHQTNDGKISKSDDELKSEMKKKEVIESDRHYGNYRGLATENISKESLKPLVELGALHKILDRLRPDDLESTSAWYSSESCCREIVLRFQNLLSEWASDRQRLERCLTTDRCLTKCEHCGVIKCSEISQNYENFQEENNEKMTAEREIDSKLNVAEFPALKSTKNMEILRNSHPVVMPRYRPGSAMKEKNTPKTNRIPVSKKFSMKGTNTNDKKIVNRYNEKNSTKINKPIKSSDTQNGENLKNISTSTNSPNLINTSQMIAGKSHQRSFEKSMNNEPNKDVTLMETVKYLARGNFDVAEDKKSEVFSGVTKLLEESCFRKSYNERKQSFAIHASRDVDFHADSDFFLSDRSRFEPDDGVATVSRAKRKAGTVILDSSNTSRETVNFSQYNDGQFQFHESDTSTFSSSSAENLIRQWIKPGCKNIRAKYNEGKKNNIKNDKSPPEIRDNAEPSLNNVQSIRAQIAEAIQKFANCSTISEADLYSQPEVRKGNPSKSFDETRKIDPEKSHFKIDNSTGISGISKEKELRKVSKQTSNTTGDGNAEDDAPSFSDSVEVTSKISDKKSMATLTVMSSRSYNCHNLSPETSERFERQILYDQVSSRDVMSRDSLKAAASKVLLIYRKILESNEEMDWESFEQLVTALHPNQRELWCDICKAVSNEAKRVAEETGATTEVCIEINPQAACKDKRGTIRSRGDEITFELDMTLHDVRAILETSENPVESTEMKERKK